MSGLSWKRLLWCIAYECRVPVYHNFSSASENIPCMNVECEYFDEPCGYLWKCREMSELANSIQKLQKSCRRALPPWRKIASRFTEFFETIIRGFIFIWTSSAHRSSNCDYGRCICEISELMGKCVQSSIRSYEHRNENEEKSRQ